MDWPSSAGLCTGTCHLPCSEQTGRHQTTHWRTKCCPPVGNHTTSPAMEARKGNPPDWLSARGGGPPPRKGLYSEHHLRVFASPLPGA